MEDSDRVGWLAALLEERSAWDRAENEYGHGSSIADDAEKLVYLSNRVLSIMLGREPTPKELAAVVPDGAVYAIGRKP
jgi:hypothetical protein